MRHFPLYLLCGVLLIATTTLTLSAAEPAEKPKRLLLVTHSGGFIHDSVAFAEEIVKEIGPRHGFTVTCYRFTGDPERKFKIKPSKDAAAVETTWLDKYSAEFRNRTGVTVGRDNIGRINAETLKKFDVVLFFTTGSKRNNQSPLTDAELSDLLAWVKAGGAFAGTHCATDTLFDTPYGDLIGGFFDGHPWHQKIQLKVEDPKHPAAAGFENGSTITDEIYQFSPNGPYSREKLHIILSVDNTSIDVKKGKRPDQDYAVSWCQDYGKGKVFYTSLGHRKEVWKDPRFQSHLIGGLNWSVGRASGDATPSAKLPRP